MNWIVRSLVFILFTYSSSLWASQKLLGYNIKKKKEQYLLIVEEENTVLMERDYRLYSVLGSKKVLVHKGSVVLLKEDPNADVNFIYSSDAVTLQYGRVPASKKRKQLIVFKLKKPKKIKKTIVFENSQF